jgi:hypothetical protein
VVDLSMLGMYATDALVFIANAFAMAPDLVVYAVSPRIAPSAPNPAWATPAGSLALDRDVLSRVGVGPMVRLVGGEDLVPTLLTSWWPLLRLRGEIATWAFAPLRQRLPEPLAARLLPHAARVWPVERWEHEERYVWPRARYRVGVPTRCTRGFEPGLLDEFVAYVGARTRAHGVPFVDFRTAGDPSSYAVNAKGEADPIHPSLAGHAAFAPRLAGAVAARVEELGR